MPAFSVLAYEDMTIKPWQQASESSGFNASIVDEWGGGFLANYIAFFSDPFLFDTVWITLRLAIPVSIINVLASC